MQYKKKHILNICGKLRKLGRGKGRLIIYGMGEGSLFTGWGYSSMVRFNRKILLYKLYMD